MGACMSGEKKSSSSNAIDRELDKDKERLGKEIKLLLLGAGESGKSTLFKQMKIIHHNGYSQDECLIYKDVIRSNIVQSMKSLITAAQKFQIPIENEQARQIAQKINQYDQETLLNISKIFNKELGDELSVLWKDEAIQNTYKKRSLFQLLDSTEYFYNDIERIGNDDFIPNQQDVLRCRVKTTGIVETEFEYNGFKFKLFDVGGQRNERKKWIHCFDGVTAVIFVTSLSEYDQKCYEDDSTLRMKESLVLFDEICNSRYFQDTDIILFFNKLDLFKKKIQDTDLKICFPSYTGGCSEEPALKFIQKEFQEKNQDENKKVHCYCTCATDTKVIQEVFDKVRDIILKQNINK